jgi:hypothetical protein
MTAFEDRPETLRGRMMYDGLLAVHALIRHDLDTVDQLAAAILDGLGAQGLQKELSALSDSSLLWQFQISCLRYCREVHLHHHAEDVALFDELQQSNPAIRPVIDRLKDDHRAVSRYLDAIESDARSLSEDDSHDARHAVADSLKVLRGHLLTHLDYEERTIANTTRRLPDTPG